MDTETRTGCRYLGRCIWGCPVDALYTPSRTLEALRGSSRFEYVPDVYVTHFDADSEGRVTQVVTEPLTGGEGRVFPVETLVLAAGALATSRIVLQSVYRRTGETRRLPGLMDNRQILVPFVNLGMIGRRFEPKSYQYHQVLLGLEAERPDTYVHCQITTLKTAMIHPIVQSVPFDLKTALGLFREVHAALGILNVNLHDTRRDRNHVTLNYEGDRPRLALHYEAPESEPARNRKILGRLKRALWKLGCVAPPGMAHTRPMGASVHYAGTLPMTERDEPWTVDPTGRSRDFPNLIIADGATFPFLPAKNITFTLMANATRIARALGPA